MNDPYLDRAKTLHRTAELEFRLRKLRHDYQVAFTEPLSSVEEIARILRETDEVKAELRTLNP